MKKSLIALATLLMAATSFAQPVATVTYDYATPKSFKSVGSEQELAAGLKYSTKLGTVDAAVVGKQITSTTNDRGTGFEVGYSNGFSVGKLGLSARAGYGRIAQLDTVVGGFNGNTSYYTVSAEGVLPVTSTLSAVVGIRHRNGLRATAPSASNRVFVGADISLSKQVALRAGVTHTRQSGYSTNGFTTALSYNF